MSREENKPQAKQPRRLPIVPVLLVVLLLGLAVFGDKGILRAIKAMKQQQMLLEEIRRLEQANAELHREIEALHSDQRYLERIARKELGMVREDELVYQFPDSKHDKSVETAPAPSAR